MDNVAGQPVARRIEFRSEIGAVVQNPQPQVTELPQGVWYLRMAQAGDVYTASYSADGVTWTSFEPLTNAAVGPAPKVGLFSLGAAQLASKPVSFDYFRLSTGSEPQDTTAPVTTATVEGTAVGGWYTGPASVSLSAVDEEGGSGVASTEYQLDGATELDRVHRAGLGERRRCPRGAVPLHRRGRQRGSRPSRSRSRSTPRRR